MKNITPDDKEINPLIRLFISQNPKNTRSKPVRIRNAPMKGLKASKDFFPGNLKSLQACGPEIKTFAQQLFSKVT